MAFINYYHNRNMKAKLDDRGVTVMYLGRAQDTHRSSNLKTKKVILSCDGRWLDKSYHAFFKTQQQLLSFGRKNPFSIFEDEDEDEDEAIWSLPDGDTNDDLGVFLDNPNNVVDEDEQGVPPPKYRKAPRVYGKLHSSSNKYEDNIKYEDNLNSPIPPPTIARCLHVTRLRSGMMG
jgi:hypothetical protein